MNPAETSDIDYLFMAEALSEAKKAGEAGEVPVGAVIVAGGEVIARGQNTKEIGLDPTGHAEMIAIREAAGTLGAWRLVDTTLYVSLEPCIMCMGAIIQARIPRLVFATLDPKAGACGSIFDISNDQRLNHAVEVRAGVMEDEARVLLKDFFSNLRENKNSGQSGAKKL